MRAAFEHFDANRSGDLDYRELRSALSAVGVELSAAETIEVLRKYDERPNLRLDLLEFNHLISDEGLVTNLGVPVKVRLIFEMHAQSTNRSGLEHRELRNALRSMGLATSTPATTSLLLQYDERPDGEMDVLEFHRLVSAAQAFEVTSRPSASVSPAPKFAQSSQLPGVQPASARRRLLR